MKTVAFAMRGRRAKRLFFLTAVLCLLLMGGSLLALEAVGTVRKVEVEKSVLHIQANGRDRVVPVAADVKVLWNEGKPLDLRRRQSIILSGNETEQAWSRPKEPQSITGQIRL